MKYKYFSILFLAVLASLGHIAFSEELNTSDDSATWWSQSIPEITLINQVDDIEAELEKLVSTEKRLTLMEEILRTSQSHTQSDRSKQETVLKNLQSMQIDIKKNILRGENDIKKIEQSIQAANKEIERIKGRQKETAIFIKKIFTEKYKNNATANNTNNGVSIFSLLFGLSTGETLAQSDTSYLVQNSTEELLIRQKSLTENLESIQKGLQGKMEEKKNLIITLKKDQEELKEAQNLEQNILSNLSQKQENIAEKIDNVTIKKMTVQAKILQKKSENATQFEAKFSEYENILKARFAKYNCNTERSPACIWMDQYLAMEKEMLSKNITIQNFVWPLVPNDGLGYHFRDQQYFIKNNVHHEGVDMVAPIGIPVQAIADGYILIKQNPSSTSPGIVIVKHPNGFMSIYIGINPNRKPMFSRVSAGDSLGTTRLYTDHSGKNNVHIELYERGKAIDPLEKLDLTLMNASQIPARYGWKYIGDMKKAGKNIDIASIQKQIGFFYVEGNTEAERQKKFLTTYAASDFQDRNIWVNQSLPESVDPTFVMCVGFAESTLGKNLTTEGNIGNVGNTDSGDRRNYSGAENGIRAIAAVVNNNWLGGYTTLDQLSGWGNPQGPIYASSQTNWHENLVKCMSAMKQKYVGNSAPFRLTQADLLIYKQEGFLVEKNS